MALIGPQIHGEDQWQFHNVDKQYIKTMVSDPDPWSKLELLKLMVIPNKMKYIANSGEGEPPNWKLLLKMKENFMGEYTKWAPSLTERLIMDKVWNMFLLLYKQDTAYYERIGGSITAMNANKDAFLRGDRLQAMIKLEAWWDENDARESKRPLIKAIFKMLIDGYQTKPFIQKAVDFCVTEFFALQTQQESYQWKTADQFDPNNWYPSKKMGGINYVILGRDQ